MAVGPLLKELLLYVHSPTSLVPYVVHTQLSETEDSTAYLLISKTQRIVTVKLISASVAYNINQYKNLKKGRY